MDEKKKDSHPRSRKRMSDVMLEHLQRGDQNNPPGSYKRSRKDDTVQEPKPGTSMNAYSQPQKEDDHITPASFPTISESPSAPGAAANPRAGDVFTTTECEVEKLYHDKEPGTGREEKNSKPVTNPISCTVSASGESSLTLHSSCHRQDTIDRHAQQIPEIFAAVGAPRILLVNQQANALAEGLSRLAPSTIFHQLLRTPPSAKSTKIFLKKGEDEKYRGYDPFDRISDEILLRIFHQLPRHRLCICALVCRRWARIVCDMSLWRRIDFAGRPLKVGVLKILLERGVEVLRLNRSEVLGDFSSTVHGAPDPRRSPLSEDSDIPIMFRRMYRIQMLDMSICNVQTRLVESMLKFCPNLRKLSLENIPVTELLLLNLAYTSPYLDTLNLAMCQGVNAKGLKAIFENCSSLEHLNISWTHMSPDDLYSVLCHLPPNLLTLDISGNRDRISDFDVEIICARCPRLIELEISDTTEITDDAVDTIGSNLGFLQKISLSRCYSIKPSSLRSLTKLKSLSSINVFGMMKDATLNMLESCLRGYKVNKERFSTVARPTPSNERLIKMWGIIPRDGPLV